VTELQEIKTPTEARQGETSGHMRQVLGASLVLAAGAFGVIYFWLSHH